MQVDRFKRLQEIFDIALEHDVESRAQFVNSACVGDPVMAEELITLLAYEAVSSSSTTVQPFTLAMTAFETAGTKTLIGQHVGRFLVEAQIGSGGMGRVFKAKRIDSDVDQTVALKLIRREIFNDALLKRFSSERKILASLHHPGIAHLIDAGTDEQGTPFVAMEYVEGLPLLDYCARNAPTVRSRLMLFRQILAAVGYAHRNLVVHRDLKPGNVLVTEEGQVKLLDFGIAKALETDQQQTATVDRFFTPAYAAPEQLLGHSITVSCDVYALGAILYILLSGVPIFDIASMSTGEIERHILKIPPERLQTAVMNRGKYALQAQGIISPVRWAKQLSGDADNIVQKSLRKEPSQRYASIEQFDDDLDRYLAQRPVHATGAGWSYRTRKLFERNSAAAAFAVLTGTAAIAGIIYIVGQNHEIRMERDRAKAALNILQSSFQEADPVMLTAGETRARDILGSAARQISSLEKRQPLLFQDLSYQIGEIQLNLGITKAGLSLIKRANRLSPDPSNAGLLLEIRGLIKASKLSDARAMIDENRTRFGYNEEFLAEDAHLLYRQKHYSPAIASLETMLADTSSARSPELQDRLYSYLAEAFLDIDQFSNSAAILEKQIKEQKRRYGNDHPMTLITRLRRVGSLSKNGSAAEAERELLAIKPMLDRFYDQGSAVQSEYHNIFGQLLLDQNRKAEALAQFREELSINQIALGPDHENTFRSHLNVALTIAYTAHDRSEAYPHFAQAIAGIEKNMGLDASLAGFSRLEAAKSYFWDKENVSAQQTLTPPNALRYFENMPEINKKEYLAGLFYGFGRQNCAAGWERQVEAVADRLRIARTLMCRYDPEAKNRPKG